MSILPRPSGESSDSYRRRKAIRRESHVENAHILLTEAGIKYAVLGNLFVLGKGEYTIHFWPKAGRWKVLDTRNEPWVLINSDYGIKHLIAYIKA